MSSLETSAPPFSTGEWFLPGPLGRRIAEFDWAAVGLPIAGWPMALRHAVSMVLRSPVPMFVLWGPKWRLIHNEAYLDILGPRRESALGRPFLEVWPEVSPPGRQVLRAAFKGTPSQFQERPILVEQDGHVDERWFTFWQAPIVGSDSRIGGILCGCIEVTERVRQQMALGDRDAHLTLALAAGQIAPWIVDHTRGQVSSSPELNRMLGLPEDAQPGLDELTSGYIPGERERLAAEFNAAVQRGGGYIETEYRHIRATDGAVRWLLLRALLELSEGRLARTIGVVMDITERKEAEERLRLLAREVDHRANNLLSVVQGLAQIAKGDDVPEFRASLMGRIAALGHAHRLLSESRWTGASLRRLIAEELRFYSEGERLLVDGPEEDVLLQPMVAQSVAMALHELATNAAKYGALSTPTGSVQLFCVRAAPDRMKLIWIETGGPRVERPTRSGVGLTMIRRAMSGVPGGAAHMAWFPSGLNCELEFPV